MDKQRALELRITLSAGCLVVGILLIALWIRSYCWGDQFVAKFKAEAEGWMVCTWSAEGRIHLALETRDVSSEAGVYYSGPFHITPGSREYWEQRIPNRWGFGAGWATDSRIETMVPHWFAVFISFGLMNPIWMRW